MTNNTCINPYKQIKLDPEIQKIVDRISKTTGLSQYEVQEVLKEYFDAYIEYVEESLSGYRHFPKNS